MCTSESPPPCLWLVKEGFPFLGKREPWMGLSFQMGYVFWKVLSSSFLILKFLIPYRKILEITNSCSVQT